MICRPLKNIPGAQENPQQGGGAGTGEKIRQLDARSWHRKPLTETSAASLIVCRKAAINRRRIEQRHDYLVIVYMGVHK